MSNPFGSSFNEPPSLPPQRPSGSLEGDGTGGLIPYKNPKALIAYYTGIVSLLCCFVGLPLGIAPVIFGLQGLKAERENPVIKGSVHAWIGIVLGSISTLASIVVLIAIIIGILKANSR